MVLVSKSVLVMSFLIERLFSECVNSDIYQVDEASELCWLQMWQYHSFKDG